MVVVPAGLKEEGIPIAALFQKGDKPAFDQLYDQFAPLLFHVIQRLIDDPKLAEYTLSKAFVKLWQQRGQYAAHKGSARSWLIGFAREAAFSVLEKFPSPSVSGNITDATAADPEKILELILVYGKTKAEVCQLLGITSDIFAESLKAAVRSHPKL